LGSGDRVCSLVDRRQLEARLLRPCEQLGECLAAKAPPRVRDPLEPRLDLLAAPRVAVESGEERTEGAGRLAQPELGVAQVVAGPGQLRGETLDRGDRCLRLGSQTGCPGALVRVDRLRGPCGRVDELCGVPHALTLPP